MFKNEGIQLSFYVHLTVLCSCFFFFIHKSVNRTLHTSRCLKTNENSLFRKNLVFTRTVQNCLFQATDYRLLSLQMRVFKRVSSFLLSFYRRGEIEIACFAIRQKSIVQKRPLQPSAVVLTIRNCIISMTIITVSDLRKYIFSSCQSKTQAPPITLRINASGMKIN